MAKYTLTYKKDKSKEICIETIGGNEHPYFKEEYEEARKLIKEIANSQKEVSNVAKYGCNNRILFNGQRGCGKTSVMYSMAEALSKNTIPVKIIVGENKEEYEVKFHCLPMVDPSHFDDNNNLLLTVITSMFSEAKRKMKKNNIENGDKDTSGEREELLKQFEKVFKSINALKLSVDSYTLETLNSKSDAEDLKEKLKELVRQYLKYNGYGDKDSSKLVLLIDDIDMSVSHAPDMLEQLRKYLELDNLIVLMSANLDQLYNEMREHYSAAFKHSLKDGEKAVSLDVEDMATKYLLKLFPTSRRINVERHINQLIDTKLKLENEGVEEDLQKMILSMIWSKTRLLFIPKDAKTTLHPIIPTNLRNLAQFLDMLVNLPNISCEDNKLFPDKHTYEQCETNVQVFKNYFMRTWIPNHLSVEEEKIFKNIPTDITEINKHLINAINVIGTKHKKRLMSREVDLDIIERNATDVNIDRDIYTMVSPNDPRFVKANKISDIYNQPSNYSYGDLLLMIDKYETYFESEEDRHFSDAIKIYYSILLFDTMFFRSRDVIYDMTKYNNEKEKGIDMVIPIQKLIGGNVYYPNYFEIIRDKAFNQKGASFDAKRAFYHKVSLDGPNEEVNKVGKQYPLFSVLYYGDIRPDRYDKDHIFDTTFNNNSDVDDGKYVTFDILSILNNMLNPCHTLSRLDDGQTDGNIWEKTAAGIIKWGGYNKVGDTYIPNAILPFYSVDILLDYLRTDCRVDEICVIPNMSIVQRKADDFYFLFELKSNSAEDDNQFMLNVLKELINSDVTDNEEETFVNAWKTNNQKYKNISECIDNLKKAIVSVDKNAIETIIIDIYGTKKNDHTVQETLNKIISQAEKNKEILSSIDTFKKNKSIGITNFLEAIANSIKEQNPVELKTLEQYVLDTSSKERLLDCIAEGRQNCILEMVKKLQVNDSIKNILCETIKTNTRSQFDNVIKENTLNEYDVRLISNKIGQYDNGKLFREILSKIKQPFFTKEDQLKTIYKYIELIDKAHKCFEKLSAKCLDISNIKSDYIIELYKNRIIALIIELDKKLMGKRDKETLIKEIHKLKSVAEVYKHVVEVFWRNSIMEICIRRVIQENVRSYQSVKNYYQKLWRKTEDMINSISEDSNMVYVYDKVFEEARNIFLEK